jgi:branched-chain amino acid transport system permease protein
VRGPFDLRTRYEHHLRIFPTRLPKLALAALIAYLVAAPFLLSDFWLSVLNFAAIAGIGAIGLNLLTGYTGQVSLGHAFFIGLGAYTAGYLGGDLGLPFVVWLPAAGLLGAAVGVLIGPFALRLRGNYLVIVTLGLVFLGEHLFREMVFITGGVGTGRSSAKLEMFGTRLDERIEIGGFTVTREIKLYFVGLVVLLVLAVFAKNLTRSKVGRAFAAVRDRDIAAEVMGVELTRHKVIAFAVSSFYAGICGALLSTLTGFIEPGSYNLLTSVNFLAMILIGGVATLSGSLMGAAFVVLLPRLVQEVPRFIPFVEGQSTGGLITTFQLETLLFGVGIVAFMILEPRGLFGMWVRAKTYWRAWPFSY